MTGTAGRVLALTGLAVGLALMALWLSGGLAGIERWAAAQQREVQNLMAGALTRLRAAEPGALWSLMGLCFAYGFVHAAGPGHGKLVIGGYGYGSQVPLGRLMGLSVAASLAQAGVAVLVVWGGIAVLDLTREQLTTLGERHMDQLGTALIGLVGLWLAWRGLRMLRPAPAMHHHHHHHDEPCGCGHAHGPSPAQVAETRSLRDALLLIAGIAARPCTGALFLLILTWRMDIFAAGVAGTFAMGVGTASVTLVVAALSVWARRGSLALAPAQGSALTRILPGAMQLGAGLLIALVCAAMLI